MGYQFINSNMKLQKPTKKQFIVSASVLAFILLVVGMYQGLKALDRFFSKNTIVFSAPIKIEFKAPIKIWDRQKLKEEQEWDATAEQLARKCVDDYFNPPEITEKQAYQVAISPSVFFDTVWANESSRGKDNTVGALHMKCRAKGLWNEIGYNPQNDYCFKDRDHAEAKIRLWLIDNCNNKTFKECLCYYNQGVNNPTCAYAEGDLTNAN